MRFSDILGGEDLKRAFRTMVDTGRVPHAIMLEENDGGGAVMMAQAFLQYLFCRGERVGGDACGQCPQCNKVAKMINPDIHYVFPVNTGTSLQFASKWRSLALDNPCFTESEFRDALGMEGKSPFIKTEEVNSLLETLSLCALQGGYRATVIYLPELFYPIAANKMLKMIEEPPQKTVFILITHNPQAVLSTIVSRCLRIRVQPLSCGVVLNALPASKDSRNASIFSDLMECLLRRDLPSALEVADVLSSLPSRDSAREFCTYASDQLRTLFLLRQKGLEPLLQDVAPDLREWAPRVRATFPRKGLEALSRADSFIRRNVNLKILFTDLVNTLVQSI